MKRNPLIPLLTLALAALVMFTACRATVDMPSVISAGDDPAEAPRAPARPGELFNLPQPDGGLESLSSYQASLTIQFEGTEGDTLVQWSRTYRMRVSRGGESFRQLEVEATRGSAGAAATRRMLAEMGGYQFEKNAQEACDAQPASQLTTLADQWEPARLLLGFSGAALAGEETVEGQNALRYTFDQSALGQDGLTQSSGEAWVDASSGVLLRYLLTQQGGEDYFGEGFAGTLRYAYEVTQVNQPQQPSLPDDCLRPEGLALPVPEDASQVDQSEDSLSFNTSLDEAALLDFYRPILEAAGWQPAETPAAGGFDLSDMDLGDMDLGDFNLEDLEDLYSDGDEYNEAAGEDGSGSPAGQGLHRFSRGLHTITLLIMPGEDQNAVTIILSSPQEEE